MWGEFFNLVRRNSGKLPANFSQSRRNDNKNKILRKKGCFEGVGLGGVFFVFLKSKEVVSNPYFSSIMQQLCEVIWQGYV